MEFIDIYTSFYYECFRIFLMFFLAVMAMLISSKFLSEKYFSRNSATLFLLFIFVFIGFGDLGVNYYFLEKLNSFDLDGDNFFSEEEATPEQQRYMAVVISGRSLIFSPIFGLISAVLYSIPFYCLLKIFVFYRKKFKKNNVRTG